MQVCEINNPRVRMILEDFRDNFFGQEIDLSNHRCFGAKVMDRQDHFTGTEYLNKVKEMGQKHAGGATVSYSYALKPNHYFGEDKEQYADRFNRLNERLGTELGVKGHALAQIYPPGGFIGWHNNADASGYNLIFTYSLEGKGWFRYIDPHTNEQVTIQDQPGWNLKAGYFGSYDEDHLVYHCAATQCWRMTISYIMGFNVDYWRDTLDHIGSHK